MFQHDTTLLEAEEVYVTLGERAILHGIDIRIAAGEWVGLLGPNGSGKTTLLRALSGTLPYDGTIRLDGRPLPSWKPRDLARRLAFVRQSTGLAFDFTVADLVLLGRVPHKGWLEGYSARDHELLERALAEVELSGFEHRQALSLSGGELQRVFLAQALVQEADLLFLDEPTAHLDVHHQYEFMEKVRGLVERGQAVLAVFHDLELAARYADRLLVLQEGRLVADGLPARVLTASLIASVFRMQARCETTVGGFLRIYYEAPLPAAGE